MTAFKVAFAFCYQPEPLQLPLPDITFTAEAAYFGYELNINPIDFTAVGSQSDNVAPPTPVEQLSFFWG